jgi:hypothetical protein
VTAVKNKGPEHAGMFWNILEQLGDSGGSFNKCYKGLKRLKLGIHKGEAKIHSVMMITIKTLLYLLTISVQLDIPAWKLFVHHVVL